MTLTNYISMDGVKKAAADGGSALGGFLVAHQLVQLTKKDNLIVHGLTAGGGLVLAAAGHKMNHSLLKFGGIGVALYGACRAVNTLVKDTIKVTDTKGIDGLPQGVKDTLAKVFPTLGDPEEMGRPDRLDLGEPAEDYMPGAPALMAGFTGFAGEMEMMGAFGAANDTNVMSL